VVIIQQDVESRRTKGLERFSGARKSPSTAHINVNGYTFKNCHLTAHTTLINTAWIDNNFIYLINYHITKLLCLLNVYYMAKFSQM
jgi:hypothetical protein